MSEIKIKYRSCLICSREFAVIAVRKSTQYTGTCPYCGTFDNGTAKGRLVTDAEMALCEDSHDWEFQSGRTREFRRCRRCGYWEKLELTSEVSIGRQWAIVDSAMERERNNGTLT